MSGVCLFWFDWKHSFLLYRKLDFILNGLDFRYNHRGLKDKDRVYFLLDSECFFLKTVCVSEEYGQAGALKRPCVFAFSRSGKMLGGWRLVDWQLCLETLIRGLASMTCLALYLTALSLGITAGSDTLTRTHQTHFTHGGKNQHTVPLTINRSPGSLRAGHGG